MKRRRCSVFSWSDAKGPPRTPSWPPWPPERSASDDSTLRLEGVRRDAGMLLGSTNVPPRRITNSTWLAEGYSRAPLGARPPPAAPPPPPPPPHHQLNVARRGLLAGAPGRPLRSCGRPSQAWPQILGHALQHRSGPDVRRR